MAFSIGQLAASVDRLGLLWRSLFEKRNFLCSKIKVAAGWTLWLDRLADWFFIHIGSLAGFLGQVGLPALFSHLVETISVLCNHLWLSRITSYVLCLRSTAF